MTEFFWWTVHTRMSAIVFLSALIIMEMAPPIVIVFGVIDLSGAIWTLIELKISRETYNKSHLD